MKRIIKLPPIKANVSAGQRYYSYLMALIKAMDKDMRSTVLDSFKLTNDVSAINGIVQIRANEWQNYADRKADVISTQFVYGVDKATTLSIGQSISQAPKVIAQSLVVKLNEQSRQVLNANKAAVIENVSLIQSIPSKYQEKLTFLVTEAAGQGRSRKWLEDELISLGHSTKERAKLIAKDQLNKITATVSAARQEQLGITHNEWHHSSRPKQPRKSHVEAAGKIYPIKKGCLIDGENIYPGQKINCFCYSSPVLIFDDGV